MTGAKARVEALTSSPSRQWHMRTAAALALSTLVGCASMFMKGGDLVSAGYRPVKVVASYRASGTVPAGVEYQLVETDKGRAIFERSADGSGTLFLTRWQDGQGDHYAGWVARSHGYEFVIPADRAASGKKFVYPSGFYEVKEIDGVSRPVPVTPVEPVAMLVPEG